MDAHLECTQFITVKILSVKYILTEMWECDYDCLLVSRKDMQIFLEKHPVLLQKPLNSRDAFYGGRTESVVSLCDVKGNEKIYNMSMYVLFTRIFVKQVNFP